MDIKTKLVSALTGIKFNEKIVPVEQFKHTGDKTYIIYQLLSEPVNLYADNEEQGTSTHFSVDIYTNDVDFDSLVKEVRKRLKSAGFIITNRGPEFYEDKTELYHIVTDCYIENLEEE